MTLRLLHLSDVETVHDDPEGAARLAGAVDALRGEDALVCATGDNTAPGALSLRTRGRQALDFYEAVAPAVETFGNHDFDYGVDAVRDLVAAAGPAWVCANLYEPGGEERFAAAETAPWTVLERGGERVGVTTEDLAGLAPGASALTVTGAVGATAEGVDAVRERDVDRVVVLSHRGNDADLAAALDVDVVLGGHEHEELVERVHGTLLVRPGVGGRTLIEVEWAGDRPTATRHDVTDSPPDATLRRDLRERMAETGLAEVIDSLDAPVPLGERDRLQGESAVGNFATDAMRAATGADVAVQIAGIRKEGALEGTVTVGDVVGLVPFENTLAVVELDGARLRETFRELSVSYHLDAPRWEFGHVSGARVVWDDRREELIEATVGGDPVRADRTYEVATTDYFAATDHTFTAFDESDVVRQGGTVPDVLVSHARDAGVRAPVEGRIERPYFEATDRGAEKKEEETEKGGGDGGGRGERNADTVDPRRVRRPNPARSAAERHRAFRDRPR